MIRKPNLELLEMAEFKVRRGRDKLEMMKSWMRGWVKTQKSMRNQRWEILGSYQQRLWKNVTFKDEGFVWQ